MITFDSDTDIDLKLSEELNKFGISNFRLCDFERGTCLKKLPILPTCLLNTPLSMVRFDDLSKVDPLILNYEYHFIYLTSWTDERSRYLCSNARRLFPDKVILVTTTDVDLPMEWGMRSMQRYFIEASTIDPEKLANTLAFMIYSCIHFRMLINPKTFFQSFNNDYDTWVKFGNEPGIRRWSPYHSHSDVPPSLYDLSRLRLPKNEQKKPFDGPDLPSKLCKLG